MVLLRWQDRIANNQTGGESLGFEPVAFSGLGGLAFRNVRRPRGSNARSRLGGRASSPDASVSWTDSRVANRAGPAFVDRIPHRRGLRRHRSRPSGSDSGKAFIRLARETRIPNSFWGFEDPRISLGKLDLETSGRFWDRARSSPSGILLRGSPVIHRRDFVRRGVHDRIDFATPSIDTAGFLRVDLILVHLPGGPRDVRADVIPVLIHPVKILLADVALLPPAVEPEGTSNIVPPLIPA